MFPRPLAVLLVLAAMLIACDDDDEPPSTPTAKSQSNATAAPVASPTAPPPSPTPRPVQPLREVTGLFVESRLSEPDAFVSVLPRPQSPFQPWDRESIVVYDLETMTEMNYGPGLVPSISPDETRLAFNLPNSVRIVDLATGGTLQEFDYTGGLASFVENDYLYMPGPGPAGAYDLRTGERATLDEIDDPELKARIENAAHGQPNVIHGEYHLRRLLYDAVGNEAACRGVSDDEAELCRSEAFEQWALEDAETGQLLLAFRAYKAAAAGPNELVIATTPRCESEDGAVRWCPEVLEELRADDPEGEFPFEEAQGTTNIFVVNIETGEARFIATATFTPDTRVVPENWPLIANEDYVVWTESYCALESPGNTRIYNRATGEVTEIDQSLWVEFTATGDLGVDPFGPKAILDIESLDWSVVLPEGVIDVGESSSGRYLFVGGVGGHGGLCG